MAPQVVIESTTEPQEILDHTVKQISEGKEGRWPEEKKSETPGAIPAETGSESGTERVGSKEGSPKAAEEPISPGIQKRFDRLTRERREAEERAEALERRIKTLEGSGQPKQEVEAETEDPEPDENGLNRNTGKPWKDWKEFSKEHAAWAYRQAAAEGEAAKQEQTETERLREQFDAHNKRIDQAREKHADFDEKVKGISASFSRDMGIAIVEAENGHEVMYYLAEHPDEAEAISKLSSARQIMAVGRISAALGEPSGSKNEAPKEKPVSKAPAPITPVSTSTSNAPKSLADLAKTDPDAYIRLRNQQEREQRRRR